MWVEWRTDIWAFGCLIPESWTFILSWKAPIGFPFLPGSLQGYGKGPRRLAIQHRTSEDKVKHRRVIRLVEDLLFHDPHSGTDVLQLACLRDGTARPTGDGPDSIHVYDSVPDTIGVEMARMAYIVRDSVGSRHRSRIYSSGYR